MKSLTAARAITMQFVLERRPERAQWMIPLSPVIALTLTAFVGAVIFALRGLDPLAALYVYFIEPLTSVWSLEQLLVKAAPLPEPPWPELP